MPEEIQGLNEALNSFKRMQRAAQAKNMRSALSAAGTPMLQALRKNAPVGDEAHKTYKGRVVAPGFLSRGIKKSARVARDKLSALLTIRPTAEAWYGSMKEFGGDDRNYPKDPWFYPTVDATEPVVRRRYFDKLIQLIGKAFRG